MALIKCKDCGHMVSTKAEKCPKCGYSVRLSMEREQEETKQRIIIVVVFVIIVGCSILGAMANDNNKNSSNGPMQDATAIADTETIKQDEWLSDTEEIRQDELPSDSMSVDVAKESDDFVISDLCATEAWEYITLRGTMTDMNGTYPIELSFEKDGDALMNCIYTNVDLGGKIRMEGEIVGSDYIFTGKDERYKFQIQVDRYTFDGIVTDGPKELSVSLENKY